jgi:hypothetical protein
MRCAVNRWGPGTTCERPTNTPASKELQERLAKMRQEREKQDTMWTEPVKEEKSIFQTSSQNNQQK